MAPRFFFFANAAMWLSYSNSTSHHSSDFSAQLASAFLFCPFATYHEKHRCNCARSKLEMPNPPHQDPNFTCLQNPQPQASTSGVADLLACQWCDQDHQYGPIWWIKHVAPAKNTSWLVVPSIDAGKICNVSSGWYSDNPKKDHNLPKTPGSSQWFHLQKEMSLGIIRRYPQF